MVTNTLTALWVHDSCIHTYVLATHSAGQPVATAVHTEHTEATHYTHVKRVLGDIAILTSMDRC